MATLQSGKCFTVPTFFGMCCRSEWQERMYIYKWHEVDQTKHEIFCVHIVCNEIQVKVNLEITSFFFYLRFPYCPNFFWFGVVYIYCVYIYLFFLRFFYWKTRQNTDWDFCFCMILLSRPEYLWCLQSDMFSWCAYQWPIFSIFTIFYSCWVW